MVPTSRTCRVSESEATADLRQTDDRAELLSLDHDSSECAAQRSIVVDPRLPDGRRRFVADLRAQRRAQHKPVPSVA